eukprot:scaffold54815_cov30-Tisochrysis_lutea.AAC.2
MRGRTLAARAGDMRRARWRCEVVQAGSVPQLHGPARQTVTGSLRKAGWQPAYRRLRLAKMP